MIVNFFLCLECRSWRWRAVFLLWRNAAQLGAGGRPLGGARSLVPTLPLPAAAERSRLHRRDPGQAGGPPRGAGEGHSHTAVVVCQTLCWAIYHWFCRSLWKVSGSITADSEVKWCVKWDNCCLGLEATPVTPGEVVHKVWALQPRIGNKHSLHPYQDSQV